MADDEIFRLHEGVNDGYFLSGGALLELQLKEGGNILVEHPRPSARFYFKIVPEDWRRG